MPGVVYDGDDYDKMVMKLVFFQGVVVADDGDDGDGVCVGGEIVVFRK